MPPPLPTPFYNACYFPYLTSEGKSLWEQLAQVNFKPSYCDNAIIDILKWLQMANPTHIFEIHPLEMDQQRFQASLILDGEGAFVSAFRSTSAAFDVTTNTELSLEQSILASVLSLNYVLGCYYCFDKSDGQHLFRFTYSDRQMGFISAQIFDYVKDQEVCAMNVALMCGHIAFPTSNVAPLRLPDPHQSNEPPSKRPSQHVYKFKDVFSGAWLPINKGLCQVCVSRNGDTIWYATDHELPHLRLSWEVVMNWTTRGQRKQKTPELVGTHMVWDGGKAVEEHAEAIDCEESSTPSHIQTLLGIPTEHVQYCRTRRWCSHIEIPLEDLSLYHQISLLHRVLITDEGLCH